MYFATTCALSTSMGRKSFGDSRPAMFQPLVFKKVTLVSEEQIWNEAQPIHVTLAGMVMLVSEVQAQNAASLMCVTPSGITMLASEEHA